MFLYGASGHCKVVIDVIEVNGLQIDGIIDDNPAINELMEYPVVRNTGHYDEAIITIGASYLRKKIVNSLDVGHYLTAIHPTAIISPRATVGEGTVILQGAIVQSCAAIGNHCIVNTGASVDHDVRLGNYVHIAPHATVAGDVSIGEGTWIGAGTVIKQGVHIGKWCMIGAGSVVVDDIPDCVVAYGNKCKVIRQMPLEEICLD